MSSENRAVFLDRDGVINQSPPAKGFITSVDMFAFLPGAVDAIGRLTARGWLVFVVTNQSCIAKGLASAGAIEEIHEQLHRVVVAAGGRIDRIYLCPHDDHDACACRKPKPGMLLQAAADFDLNLAESWMVGDSDSDMRAGLSAGCKTVLLGSAPGSQATLQAASLPDAVHKILMQPTSVRQILSPGDAKK
jgi:histidinol-phosphate phosphatase family protein